MITYIKMPAACFSTTDAAAILAKFGIKPEVEYCKNYTVKAGEAVTVKVEMSDNYMFLSAHKDGREIVKSYILRTAEIETAIAQINKRCAMYVPGFQQLGI